MKAIYYTTVALLLMVGLLAGCKTGAGTLSGYTLGTLYPDDVRTVAAPLWHVSKDVYRRGLEFRLTEAVQKRIEADAGYKIVGPDKADTLLEGTIERIEQRVLRMNPDTGMPRELELTVIVSFTWTDLRTSAIRVQKTNFPVSGTYIPPAPFSEDFFQGSEDVVNRMARRVVECMENDF